MIAICAGVVLSGSSKRGQSYKNAFKWAINLTQKFSKIEFLENF